MRCKVCGGTVSKFGNKYFQCDYCNQFFGLNEEEISSDRVYSYAVERINAGTQEGCEEAIQLFSSIPQFKDSTDRVKQGYGNIERMRVEEEEKRLEDERKRIYEEKQKIEIEKKTRATMRILGIAAVLVVCIIVILVHNRTEKNEYYESAKLMFENGEYENAIITFQKAKGYLDSNEYISKAEQEIEKIETTYNDAISKYEEQNFEKSYELFVTIREYKDVEEYIDKIYSAYLSKAETCYEGQDYESAIVILNEISTDASCYGEVTSLIEKVSQGIKERDYRTAIALYDEGELLLSQQMFIELGNYEESVKYKNMIGEYIFTLVEEAIQNEDYDTFYEYSIKIDDVNEWERYVETKELVSDIKSEYSISVWEQAKTLLLEQGYETAEEYINSKVNKVFLKEEAKLLIEDIAPVPMVSLNAYDCSNRVRYGYDFTYSDNFVDKTTKFTDNAGVEYDSGIYFSYGHDDERFIEFDVKDYSIFTASIICNEAYKTGERGAYVKIIGDGKTLYLSDFIVKGFSTKNISLDISGVNILRIEFTGGLGVDNAHQASVVNPYLYK